MDERYELWIRFEDRWLLEARRQTKEQTDMKSRFFESRGTKTRITPAPVMTADAWVAGGE